MTISILTGSLTSLDHHLYSSCELRTHFDATQFQRHLEAMCRLTRILLVQDAISAFTRLDLTAELHINV